MASAVVAELEAGLQAMLSLKPPGVSGSRITNITALCVANVQYESVLIQKLFTHFKKAPGTHKLGVLYVVDSVTRKWLDQAKAQGQTPSLSAPDGTFAAGVHRVTELIPILMNDITATAPEDQKEKIKKLVDIWEKGQTFPASMVNSFREKLNAPRPNESTTPPGSPPTNLMASLGAGSKPPAPPANNVPSILDTLANIARQNASSAQSNPGLVAPVSALAPASAPVTAPIFTTSGGPPRSGAMPPAPGPMQAQPSLPFLPTSQGPPQPAQPVNVPGLPYGFPSQGPPAPAAPSALPVAPGAVPPPQDGSSNPAAATVQLVAALAAQGIPIDKIAGVIQMMGQAGTLPPAAQPQMPQPTQTGYAGPPPLGGAPSGPVPWDAPRPDDVRDRQGYHDGLRSPNRPRGRSRSRSPSRWDGRGSPRSRANERAFDYGRPGSPGRGRPDDRHGHMPDYRQRSPRGRRGESPVREPFQQEKWVEYDNSLPSGCIKVYSRTLFVGGVTCSENELREVFSRFGQVQTCIVNKDKRHAFVKMFFRKDAERAKAGMEEARNQEHSLRTRWGVGFGPRDCSDYQSGISIIPIHKLTEADRKWMLTAPFGGSGGRPIVQGLCVEEPDIEIGAGVSSKAISRRMQTDKGGNHGPKSSRRAEDEPMQGFGGGGPGGGGQGGSGGGGPPGGGGGGGRWRHGREKHHGGGGGNGGGGGRDQRRGGGGDDRKGGGNSDDPIVMDLPAGITMGPNGINYPPNFAFGA